MSDQPATKSSVWERSTTRHFFLWLFSWRGKRRIFIALAWVVTIIGLCYGEENWRGKHAWNQYREAALARGESVDFSAYIPKSVPDEQNFAATPFLKSFFQHKDNGVILTNDLWFRADNYVFISETKLLKRDKGRRHFTDLVAWQMASVALQAGALKRDQHFETDKTDLAARAAAAPAVLEGMKPDAAAFAELRDASTREFSRYPLVYDLENPWAISLPHLVKIKQAVQRLNLEACAELAAGQSDQALADVKLALSLADSIKSEPLLISYLVRIACVQIAIQPVWEGLAEHRWTDSQLQELQGRFSTYNFLADQDQPLKAERAAGVLTVDLAKKKGLGMLLDSIEQEKNQTRPNKDVLNLIGWVSPGGWYDLEKLNYSELFDTLRNGVVDPAAKTVSPSRLASNVEEFTRQLFSGSSGSVVKAVLHHRIFASTLLPALSRIAVKAAMAQTAADQSALACALERYRLANGQFPETLDALTPRFIARAPNDVISGQPYKYSRTDDGQFVLYSVGWNEKDDGGVPGKTLFDQAQGDWVWSYPAR